MLEFLNGPTSSQVKRYRVNALRLAFVADKEEVKEHAPWQKPELGSRADSTRPSVLGGADDAISAWVGEERNRKLGQESYQGVGNCMLT